MVRSRLPEDDPIEADQFRQRPRLKRATARCVRQFGIGDLGNMPETAVIDMIQERREKARARLPLGFTGIAAHSNPGFDEGADQPRPDRALVICAVALTYAALVMRRVTRLFGRERAQAQRRPETALDNIDNSFSRFAFDQRQRQAAHGKNLIGPEGSVELAGFMIGVDDVEQVTAFHIPEPASKSIWPRASGAFHRSSN